MLAVFHLPLSPLCLHRLFTLPSLCPGRLTCRAGMRRLSGSRLGPANGNTGRKWEGGGDRQGACAPKRCLDQAAFATQFSLWVPPPQASAHTLHPLALPLRDYTILYGFLGPASSFENSSFIKLSSHICHPFTFCC